MSFIEMLIQDHRKVTQLLTQIENSEQQSEENRKMLFDTVKKEIRQHTKIEEDLVYPVLEKIKETKDLIADSYKEHKLVENIITEMEKIKPSDSAWLEKIKDLKKNLDHHVQEEEHELFPKIKNLLEEDKISEIDEKMREMRHE